MGYECLGTSHINSTPMFVIKTHIFGFCVFLDYNTSTCKIYDQRPEVCRRFPIDPSGRSGVTDYCLLYKLIKKKNPKKLQFIEEREALKFNSRPNLRNLNQLMELDLKNLDEKFEPYVREKIGQESILFNEWGSFIVRESPNSKVDFNPLFRLIDTYTNYFDQPQPFISVIILNRDYSILSMIQGVFRSKVKYNSTQIQKFYREKMDSYYLKKFDGSGLEGIIFLDELKKDHSTWESVWIEMKQAIKSFQPKM